MKKQTPLFRLLTWFFIVWIALPANMTFGQVFLETPILLNSNTVRLVVDGPTTNIQYKLYGTNDIGTSVSSWPLLIAGQTNQVIFDLAMPWTNAGFFIVTSNYVAGTNPPPKVATPIFTPPSASGNASVQVTVTCDTPGAVIYYTTDGTTPAQDDNYIPSGGKLAIQCATTLKARAFRTGFDDSDVATGVYSVNCPPEVFAGLQQITSGSQVTLEGVATDDGLSAPLSNYWQKISGPGMVTFGNVNSTNSTATLSQDGIYVLQLNSYDGFWTSSSQVTIARNPAISVAITAPATSSTFSVPTNIALEASATTTSGSITQVQFYAGSLLIGTDTEAPFTYEWRNLPAGNHDLYAIATSTDPDHFSLMSDPVSITVNFPTDIGRFTLAASDLTIPVVGLPITVSRSHDPRHGSGWSLGENMRLDYEAVSISKSAALGGGYTALRTGGQDCIVPNHQTLVTVALAPTELYYFRPRILFQAGGNACVGSNSVTHLANIRFVFDAVGPLGGQLSPVNAPGDVGMISDGSQFGQWYGGAQPCTDDGFGECDEGYEPDWSQFTFTAPDGTQYKFDSSGKLYQRTDRNNNSLTYDYSGITHSSGKQVTFTRDGFARITEIYDPIAIASSGAPAIKYDYDANGNLTNVARLVNRAGAGTYENTGYRYDDASFSHHITRVIDPRGVTVVSNVLDAFGRLTRRYDALGNFTSISYEQNGRRQVFTDRNNQTTRQDYTEAGQVASVRDAEGAVTSYLYDANGRQVAEINPLGATNSFEYNERDEVVAVVNELSFSSSSTYNSYGQPLTVVDSMGNGTTNDYDSLGNLIAVTNALGIVTHYGYDSQGNRNAETNAVGLPEQAVTLYQHDEFGYVTNITDALGNTIAYAYDLNGNQATIRRERTLATGSTQLLWTINLYDAANRVIAAIEPDGLTNRTAYNAIGQIAYTTNKLSVTTRFDYDARGLLTNTVFALGTAQQVSEQTQYDPEGRRTNSVDRAGRSTSYTYDGLGRLKRTVLPDGTYTENLYDAGGRLFATVQGPQNPGGLTPPPSGLTTRYTYDAAGRRTAVIDELNQTNRYAYDRNGNQTNFVDALNRTTTYVLDRLNRQVKVTFPDNTSESYGYDGLGRRIAITNQAGMVARFSYNKVSQLVAVTNGFGSGTINWATYAYDQVGNQTNQVDSLNRLTRFEYDAVGRRTRTVLPGGQTEGFAYDSVGNLTRHTNFNSVIITNQYDTLNRLTNKSSVGGYQVALTFTPTGQRATMSDPTGSYTFAYNSRDQLLTNSGPAGTLVYSYDIFGRLASIASARGNGASVTYAYDGLNRFSTVVDAMAGTATYGYDAVGNLKTVRYPNSVTNTYTYDSLNRLTNLVAVASSGTLASFAYKLAPAGNRTNLVDNVGGTGRTFSWSYDPLYRLTNEVITGASPSGTTSYQYDAVGNRTNRTSNVAGIGNQALTYNTNDWLTTDTYDNNGSTTASGGNSYAYDVEGRLTNFNSGAVTYGYNADGIRVRKTSGGVTTLYLVDDRNPTGYPQVLEELTVSGGATNLAKVYTYGHDLIAQRQVSGGVVHYFGYDGSGSVRYLTATNATISDTYVYDAFGSLLASSGSTPNDYRYTGEQFDGSLGFYYLRARYLNPETGRFWTRDTLAGQNDDPVSLHRYLYASANPINNSDPTGHETLAGQVVTAGGIGSLASSLNVAISQATARALFLLTRAVLASDKVLFYLEAGTAAVGAGAIIANGAVQLTSTAFEAVADMTDKVVNSYANNNRQIPAGWSARGFALEQIGGQHLGEAYLGGNVNTIDVFEGRGARIAASFKSHALDPGLPDLEGRYIAAFTRDAESLIDLERRQISGIRADGSRFNLAPGALDAKIVYAPIPENHARVLLSTRVSQSLREVAQRTRTIIVPVPVRKWSR